MLGTLTQPHSISVTWGLIPQTGKTITNTPVWGSIFKNTTDNRLNLVVGARASRFWSAWWQFGSQSSSSWAEMLGKRVLSDEIMKTLYVYIINMYKYIYILLYVWYLCVVSPPCNTSKMQHQQNKRDRSPQPHLAREQPCSKVALQTAGSAFDLLS
jgi:hypothetical protein